MGGEDLRSVAASSLITALGLQLFLLAEYTAPRMQPGSLLRLGNRNGCTCDDEIHLTMKFIATLNALAGG
jgi:hypothetical protein